ncbi:unnamed protein product [Vicia faba]|uniref:Uncharacterized protein n=1 Tax=Vicia faba TaxID=3906 RepID=A0AAV0ZQB4_VICFA|nr:unnamed protein product [Vicia faba]
MSSSPPALDVVLDPPNVLASSPVASSSSACCSSSPSFSWSAASGGNLGARCMACKHQANDVKQALFRRQPDSVWLQSELWLQRNRKPHRLELQENNKPLTRQDLLDKNKRVGIRTYGKIHLEEQICHYQESFNKMPNEAVISKKIILEVDMAQLLYFLMSGRRVDISQIIATEMKNVAESGKEFGAGTISAHPLVYPSFIMGFLIASRVRIPNVVPFVIKTKVNETYMERYCLEKKKKKRQEDQAGKTSSTMNYDDWDLRLLQAFTYIWNQNDYNQRIALSLHDSFHMLHIQPGG